MTRAGRLHYRITLFRATAASNHFNEPTTTWCELTTIWAARRDASAGESYWAQEVGAEISARFTIRWSSQVADVDAHDRLVCDSREFNITAVRDVGRREWREIDAVSRSQGTT